MPKGIVTFTNTLPHQSVEKLRRFRKQAMHLEAGGVKNTTTQLLRFWVCPCISLGYYATCCKPTHGSLEY